MTEKPKGMTCEIHLLIESRRHMFPQDYGYCARKASYWLDGMALCNVHMGAVERVLAKKTR